MRLPYPLSSEGLRRPVSFLRTSLQTVYPTVNFTGSAGASHRLFCGDRVRLTTCFTPKKDGEWGRWSRSLARRGHPDYSVLFLQLRRRVTNCALDTSEDDVFALLNAYGLYLYY